MPTYAQQRYTKSDYFIWFVTFLFFVTSNISDASGPIMFATTLLVLVASNFKLVFYKFHVFTLLFCLYSYATTFWALNGRFTISVSNSIFQTLVCLFVFYSYWKDIRNIRILLKIFMYGGFVVIIYTYYFYGVTSVFDAQSEHRLDNAFSNVNTISMLAALIVMIDYYFYLFVKKSWWNILLVIPCIIIISATQSRKGLVVLVMSVFILYYYKQMRSRKKDDALPYIKIFSFILIGVVALLILAQTRYFSGLSHRMDGLIASVTGEGQMDASSYMRMLYRNAGWEQFKETPFLGVGMNNSIIVNSRATGHATYLHSNYIELLCNGGIFALILFYAPLLYILFNELKYVKKDSTAVLIATWIMIRLVTDWGAVSYVSKMSYFYLMIFFIHLDNLKRKYPEIK